jgi:LmbE family N-acetylglucosaminyl deacetylase
VSPYRFPDERPLFFTSLSIPASLRVAVLAPHPDDFDAIGVTMRHLHHNGNPIFLGVATSGASGVDPLDCPDPGRRGPMREQEQRESCRFFGLPDDRLFFLRLQEDAEGHPEDTLENLALVRAFLLHARPGLVFLPHPNDTNPGHVRTFALFHRAAQGASLSLVAVLNRDPKTIAMRPDLYTLFGEEEAAWKSRLLLHHKSQNQRNLRQRGHGFDERILRVDRTAAAELVNQSIPYAEVFEVEYY